VLDSNGKGIADAVVYIAKVPGAAAATAPAEPLALDQIHNEYVPRVLPVVLGTTVVFPNKDNTRHHVYSFPNSFRGYRTP
jgi:hypothetical protein